MVLELVSLFALAAGAAFPGEVDAAVATQKRVWAVLQEVSRTALIGDVSFRAAERTVSNWRVEAAQGLSSPPQSLAKLVAADPPGTPRCIKLNNYWCVKRAGWAGEIAADADGHVAFASAMEGAVVAVMLLRRYYLTYDRRSAQAIVSRWAPPQCDAPRGIGRPSGVAHLDALTTHGIATTLRARWLASHLRGFAAPSTTAKPGAQTAARQRRTVVADRAVTMMAAPEIAVGMGERPDAQSAAEKATMRLAVALMIPIPSSHPGLACSDDSARIRQYALRAVEGTAVGPDDDLQLFAADGSPGTNLPTVMQNMAKVEIGPFAARNDLIAAAIQAEAQQDQARRSAAAQLTGAGK